VVNPIATIGYETATLPDVIARLRGAGVELVLDVRAVASSRRAGFSKTLLAASLGEAGIGYQHLRDLGTPKAGRQAARAGRITEMHAIFEGHMQAPEAQIALARAIEASLAQRSCLLCYEDDPAGCHRTLVAALMTERTGAPVVDL
jgi:uncharacterized protein (DUF488 family)